MNRSLRAVCIACFLLLVLLIPLAIPSGALLEDHKTRLLEEKWEREETGSMLLDLLFPRAHAETLPENAKPLPIDFSPGYMPDPGKYTADGYSDDSIQVTLETREQDGVTWRIVDVVIAHPSQLRTVISKRDARISDMAAKQHAVIAINGDHYVNKPDKKTFEYRMGKKLRHDRNLQKDLLIIDENADFHLIVGGFTLDDVKAWQETSGHLIINAFTFGPALVKDGELLTTDTKYSYNPMGNEPRMAIGQMGALHYVLVLAEGRTGSSSGVTHQELADFMYDIGCWQAYNLDGGNSATLVFGDGYYQTSRSRNNERSQSDAIYFATLMDLGLGN
ncbi:MAG: phosphodiester glycosidase family protein [Christensenellales bacterium]